MKLKTLLILLVITTVLAGLSTLMLRPKTAKRATIGARLLPELPVNTVARLTLVTAEATVALVKGSDVWQVENRFGYAADFDKISEFVRKFSKLKIGRSFEGTEETLARLQLLDPDQADADPTQTGTRVELADAAGKPIAAYILGSARSTDSGSGGQYVRQVEGETVYLVDESFRFLKKTPAEWLQQDLLDIKESEVRQVSCYAAGSTVPRFEVRRPAAGKAAALAEVPPERKVDTTKVDQLVGALAPLKIKDLAAEREQPAQPPEGELYLHYALFNGQQIRVYPRKVGEDEGARYELQVQVSYAPPPADASEAAETAAGETASGSTAAAEEAPEAAAQEESTAGETASTTKSEAPTAEEMQALAADLNAKVSGWTFLMEEWQWKSFITTVEGLLEAKEEEAADT